MIQTKGVFVGASSSGGGAASSIVIGNPVTGGGAGRVLYEDSSQNLAASANFTFDGTTASLGSATQLRWSTDAYVTRYASKQLMISGDGTGATTNAGLILGYGLTSGYGGIFGSQTTPSATNYSFLTSTNGNETYVGAATILNLGVGNIQKVVITNTAGAGPSIAAGTAATNAPRALSISQTWTDGTTGNIGIVGNFDMGATGTATGKLLSLQAGAAGTTEVFNVDYVGRITALGGAVFMTTNSALTDGAGASAGTITNAPSVGNPTKWIGINDNGTTRYIPAW